MQLRIEPLCRGRGRGVVGARELIAKTESCTLRGTAPKRLCAAHEFIEFACWLGGWHRQPRGLHIGFGVEGRGALAVNLRHVGFGVEPSHQRSKLPTFGCACLYAFRTAA